jgi:hypothetical protein
MHSRSMHSHNIHSPSMQARSHAITQHAACNPAACNPAACNHAACNHAACSHAVTQHAACNHAACKHTACNHAARNHAARNRPSGFSGETACLQLASIAKRRHDGCAVFDLLQQRVEHEVTALGGARCLPGFRRPSTFSPCSPCRVLDNRGRCRSPVALGRRAT